MQGRNACLSESRSEILCLILSLKQTACIVSERSSKLNFMVYTMRYWRSVVRCHFAATFSFVVQCIDITVTVIVTEIQ